MSDSRKTIDLALPPEHGAAASSAQIAPVLAPSPPVSLPPVGAYNPDISKKAWESAAQATLWVDNPAIRAGVMIGTRGIAGALAFTAMSAVMAKGLGGKVEGGIKTGYNPSDSWAINAKNPFKLMAKAVDWSAGNAIKGTVEKIAQWSGHEGKAAERIAMNAVHFKNTWYRRTDYNGKVIWGQSLGAEAVKVTLPFAAMSFTNKLAFDGIMALDPNAKHDWKDENGHIKVGELAKSIGGTVFTAVTKSTGEDFVVAIPYVYGSRWLSRAINKISPGAKKDLDAGLMGASVKMSDDHKVIGTFTPEALADLHIRFTGYNVLTKWFRSAYDHIAGRFEGRNDRFYGAPDRKESKGFLGETGDVIKGMVRDGIKAVIFMFPTVPMFYTRVFQKKDMGFLINKQGAVMTHDAQDLDTKEIKDIKDRIKVNYFDNEKSDELVMAKLNKQPIYYSLHTPNGGDNDLVPFKAEPIGMAKNVNPILKEGFAKSQKGKTAIGAVVTNFQDSASKLLDSVAGDNKAHTRNFIKNSLAYTPYFMMKDWSTIHVDQPRTDVSLEQMIDGAVNLDWSQFTTGMRATAYALTNNALPDAEAEKEAQRRIKVKSNYAPLTWQERTISKQAELITERLPQKNKLVGDYRAQEEMRTALKTLMPPTNSIH